MYPYSTTTLQERTISVIEDNTEAIENLNKNIINIGGTIAICILIIIIRDFIKICVGGK